MQSELVISSFFLARIRSDPVVTFRYYPNLGMTPSAARQMMNNAEKKTGSPEEMTERKLKQFRKIMAQLPPVYRHVALQSTKSPTLWFDQRLNYSRSVATNSIVGYTFGVGDRHPSNILVDQVTGELIHIDLGIAFDQVCWISSIVADDSLTSVSGTGSTTPHT